MRMSADALVSCASCHDPEGHRRDLDDFISDVYDEPHMQRGAVGELDPDVRGIEMEGDDVEAFLRMLDCPPWPADVL